MPRVSRETPCRHRVESYRGAILVSVGWSAAVVLVMLWILASSPEPLPGPESLSERQPPLSLADRTGSLFTPVPVDLYRAPTVREVILPPFPSGDAVWGATGRDQRGHIWIGVTERQGDRSARLFELDPTTGELWTRGSVVEELKAHDVYRPGEGQAKIHSRIVPADDGYLYFSSTDEEGESPDGSSLPIWGSHLWRLRPEEPRWEHLFTAREGLIAVSGTGRWVYALGYWDHVVHQYDTRTGRIQSLRVGSVGGHASRNFLSDLRGHVYVPRLRHEEVSPFETGAAPEVPRVTLVELDPALGEVAETPLEHYLEGDDANASHGIIALTYLADGSMVFATHPGYLYRIVPADTGPAAVQPLGWFHPRGSAYTPSLFTFSGERYLAGIARAAGGGYEWLVYDLETRESVASAIDIPSTRKLLLYGSITRDDRGRFYVVGRHNVQGRDRPLPLVLQLSPGS